MSDDQRTLPLFNVNAAWFHIFKEMIETETWAKMGYPAKSLYPVIKSFANQKNGASFPSYETMMKYSGLSRSSIVKALAELEDLGYVNKVKIGTGRKKNLYELKEKLPVINKETGEVEATASFDYIPFQVGEAVKELKKFVATNMDAEGKALQYIHIDKLTLNVAGRDIVNNEGGEITQISVDDKVAGAEIMRGIRDRLEGKETRQSLVVDKLLKEK